MKIKYLFCLFIGISLLQACYKDKGNYDYQDVNEVTITLPKTYFSKIPIGDPIRIEPTLTFKNPKDTSYFRYEWHLGEELVSTKRNLDITWPTLGSTYGNFRVIDTLTRSKYTIKFEISQISPYLYGWMVLYDKNGESEFCYIQETNDQYKSFIDFYQERNKESLGTNPVRMVEHYTPSRSEILILQKGGQGCVEIDGESLEKTVTTQQEFLNETLPTHFAPSNASYSGYINYIQNSDGKVFSRKDNPTSLHTSRYTPLPLSDNGQELEITQIIQTVDSKTYFILLFDKTNRRFVGVATQSETNGGKLTNLYRQTYPENTIPLNNVGDNQLIYAAAQMEKTYLSDFTAIFKTPNGQYLLQEFQIEYIPVGAGLEVKSIPEAKITGDGLFRENSLFHLTKRRPYLFFTTGANSDQLYYLDLATHKTHLYKDFKGTRIATICTNNNSNKMGVGLENGQFYIFDITDQWLGREIKQLYFQDHLGKIVHSIYKFGTKAGYETGT